MAKTDESKGISPMSDKTEEIQDSQKRFGIVAIEHGLITLDQLGDALKAQAEDSLKGRRHRRLGEILCDHGVMKWADIGVVLATLGGLEHIFGA